VKKCSVFVVLVLLFAVIPAALSYTPKDKEKAQAGRLLTGKVLDRQDGPLADSVVYLSDTRTHAVKTYITGPDGAYHFPALSLNTDYELYAQCKGKKSDTKTVSQFDTRQQVNINLKIDTR
jgi:Carboxypeptidase regulatory-like domain